MDITLNEKTPATLADPLKFAKTNFPDSLADDEFEAFKYGSDAGHCYTEISNAPIAEPASTPMLLALNRTGKHIYAGTVPAAEKARRRAAGKALRAARKVGR